MVKITKYIIYSLFIVYILLSKASSIESAAHKVEVAKCFGILMTIKNNSLDETGIRANRILNLYLNKILDLEIGSLMMKDMSDKGANLIYKDIIELNIDNINKAINKCIQILKVG